MLAMGLGSLLKETQVTLLNETEALDTKDRGWGQEGGVWSPEHLLVLWKPWLSGLKAWERLLGDLNNKL